MDESISSSDYSSFSASGCSSSSPYRRRCKPSLSSSTDATTSSSTNNAVLVDVQAPATLSEGYVFWASPSSPTITMLSSSIKNHNTINNNNKEKKRPLSSVPVRVPSGGVESGQTFRVPLLWMDDCDEDSDRCSCSVDDDDDKDDDAMARRQQQQQQGWRDGLCACFRHGLCHPHTWNAWLCPQILLGQLLVRMNMTQRMVQNPFQRSDDDDENNTNTGKNTVNNDSSSSNNSSSSTAASIQSAFRKIMVLIVLLSLYDALVAPPLFGLEMDEDTGEVSIVRGGGFPVWHQLLYLLLSFPMTVWGVMVVVRLRAAIRHKYHIPTGRLGRCEDFVCVCCCNCCVMGQMARQTADYGGDEPASCCSLNGIRMDEKKGRNDDDDDDSYYDEEENSNTSMEDSLLLRSPVPFETWSSSFSSSTSSTMLISCSDHSASSSSACEDCSRRNDVRSSSSNTSNYGPLILATIV